MYGTAPPPPPPPPRESTVINQLCDKMSLFFLRVLQSEENHKKTKERFSETNRRLDQALAALQELGQENQSLQVRCWAYGKSSS